MIFLFFLFISFNCFATTFNCNLQLIPRDKVINAADSSQYILEFEVKTPIQKKKEFSFKHLKVTFYPLQKKLLTVKFENTKKNTFVATDYLATQEIISLNTQDIGSFICWSEKAQTSAKDEKLSYQ